VIPGAPAEGTVVLGAGTEMAIVGELLFKVKVEEVDKKARLLDFFSTMGKS